MRLFNKATKVIKFDDFFVFFFNIYCNKEYVFQAYNLLPLLINLPIKTTFNIEKTFL